GNRFRGLGHLESKGQPVVAMNGKRTFYLLLQSHSLRMTLSYM
ncbi:hypothetical protein EE612_058202, partial [Oryza sativa]